MMTPHLTLSDRAGQILKALITLYIDTVQPVSSKSIASLPDISVSPATVRNIMAQLEMQGLIHSPHTSAGRIPTALGYRLFIDKLLSRKPVAPTVHQKLQVMFDQNHSHATLPQQVSTALSGLTQLASIIRLPQTTHQILSHVEFLPLAGQRILVILVLNETEVQNRVITLNRTYSRHELEQIGRYLTERFSGHALNKIRTGLLEEIKTNKTKIDAALENIVDMAEQVFNAEPKPEVLIEGHDHLLQAADDATFETLQQLLASFRERQKMLKLFDQCIQADGVQIILGSDNQDFYLDDWCLVTAQYQLNDNSRGMVGVIGPTRMHYDRVVPLVDLTAKLMSQF